MIAAASRPLFSVFTATLNRAEKLERVYTSLRAQTVTDFEWIIVDDGSTDKTRELVDVWLREAPFPIVYHWKPNGGLHTAMNAGAQLATGLLFAKLDSDDYYYPEALERLRAVWLSIPENVKPRFAGVIGLAFTPNGELVGDKFPASPLDCTPIERTITYRVAGDKLGAIRTDLYRMHPFPEFIGERRVPTSFLLDAISNTHRIRYVNEPIGVRDYQGDGLSARIDLVRARSPVGSRLKYLRLLNEHKLPPAYTGRAAANYVRYSLHCGIPISNQFADVRQRSAIAFGFLPGIALYTRDLFRIRRDARRKRLR